MNEVTEIYELPYNLYEYLCNKESVKEDQVNEIIMNLWQSNAKLQTMK